MSIAVLPVGDSAVMVQFDERIDVEINQRVHALAELVRASKLPGVLDVVPAFRSVTVSFDPLQADVSSLTEWLQQKSDQPSGPEATPIRLVRVPVCYGGAHGPDLEAVALRAGMTASEVIACHSSPTYRVYMLGFVPGFPYMGTVDSRIATPRHETPRLKVPAGSVAIAAGQTGIYPIATPGGWQLIGWTPVKTFDPSRPDPFLIKAGDSVQFYPVRPGEDGRTEPDAGPPY